MVGFIIPYQLQCPTDCQHNVKIALESVGKAKLQTGFDR